MRKFLFYLLLPCALSANLADEEALPPSIKDPKEIVDLQLKSLDHIQACTRQTLQQITALKSQVELYKKAQEAYLDNVDNRKLLRAMLQAAGSLQQALKENHMQHFFDSEFIAELNLLHKLNQNISLPKPPSAEP